MDFFRTPNCLFEGIPLPDIQPFKGIRYRTDGAGNLSKVTAPPYDVIDADSRAELAARDVHNVVRLILPEAEDGGDRYAQAGKLLDAWTREGVLVEDARPGIYVVSQAWSDGDVPHRRTGFVAAVTLEAFGEGRIYPHENTLSAPKADRLKLIKATRANLSQVFALFPDEHGDVDAWLREVTARAGDATTTDDAGVVTTLWCVFDADRIDALRAMLAEREVFIADGHHRYETALDYQRFCAETHAAPPDGPQNAIMMLCVAMNNEGLVTYPTHRLLSADVVDVEGLISRLRPQFDVHPIATFSHRPGELDAALRADATPNTMVLYVGKHRPPLTVRPKPGEALLKNTPAYSPAWRSLDVSILQFAILEGILGLTLEHITSCEKIGYVHDADDAVRRVDAGEFAAAFILRPTPVSAVAAVAEHLEKMPPKSTYFWPKAVTGMVLRRL